MLNKEEYKNNYMVIWNIRYNDYKKYNELNSLKERIEEEIKHKINILNNGYTIALTGRRPLTEYEIDVYTLEVEALIDLLNRIEKETLEHEVFTGRLNNKNVFCEWDKLYKYIFYTPSNDSINYTFIRSFEDWINHKINNKNVRSFIMDNASNIFVIE